MFYLNTLGVTLTEDLRASPHVRETLSSCSSSLYIYPESVEGRWTFPDQALHTVTHDFFIMILLEVTLNSCLGYYDDNTIEIVRLD